MSNTTDFEARQHELQRQQDWQLVHRVAVQHGLPDEVAQTMLTYVTDHAAPGAKSAQFTVPRQTEVQPVAQSEGQQQVIAEMIESRRSANPFLDALGIADDTISEMLKDDPKRRAERQADKALRDDLEQLGRQFGLVSEFHINQLERIARSR